MDCRQFDQAADSICLTEEIRERTKYPRCCVAISLPVEMDDGSLTLHGGYRMQHSISTGPATGASVFMSVTIGEVAALIHVDELEMLPPGTLLRRSQRWRDGESKPAFRGVTRTPLPPLHAGTHPSLFGKA